MNHDFCATVFGVYTPVSAVQVNESYQRRRLSSPRPVFSFFFFFCLHNCLCFTLLSCQNQLAVSPRCVSFFHSSPKQANVITVSPYCICQTLPCCLHSFVTLEIHFHSKLPGFFFFFPLPLRLGLTFTSPP